MASGRGVPGVANRRLQTEESRSAGYDEDLDDGGELDLCGAGEET
jgi:hypothetical protein